MGAEFLVLMFLCCLGLACLAGLGIALYVASATLAELSRAARRFFRRPQFGMRKLFSLTVIAAVTCMMLRGFGIDDAQGIVVVGAVLAVWAVGIVCGAEFALGDFFSQFGPKRRQWNEPPLELWEDAPPGDPPA